MSCPAGSRPEAELDTNPQALVVAMPLWLVDVFGRRVSRQGRLLQQMSRAAFAAFIIDQVVLVGAVLATRRVGWSPEAKYLIAAALAVAGSFGASCWFGYRACAGCLSQHDRDVERALQPRLGRSRRRSSHMSPPVLPPTATPSATGCNRIAAPAG